MEGSEYAAAFGPDQVDALALPLLEIYDGGSHIVALFWGLWPFPLGVLAYRSGFVPGSPGAVLVVGSVGYVIDVLVLLVVPNVETVAVFGPPLAVLLAIGPVTATLGEFSMRAWLLVKGARTRRPLAEPTGWARRSTTTTTECDQVAQRMKAVVMHGFGPPDVLALEDVPQPTPGDDEVLIRVRATTVTAGDCELRRLALPLTFRLPIWLYVRAWKRNRLIPGQEVAGEVESVGSDVTRFEPGEEVFAATAFRFGGAAEFVCLPESYPIARVPGRVAIEEAATLPTGGLNAMHFLRSADVGDGDSVLINGAGGSIGTYAVQVAKAWGADVTCVDSGEKLDLLASLGADRVVDYTREDFTERGEVYDVVVDVVGTSPFSRTLSRLAPGGRYVLGNPTMLGRVRGAWTNLIGEETVISSLAGYTPDDVDVLVDLVESGAIGPVVDRRYPLDEIADAHRYVEGGEKVGNVVIDVA